MLFTSRGEELEFRCLAFREWRLIVDQTGRPPHNHIIQMMGEWGVL